MKLIREYSNDSTAEAASDSLRNSGVMTVVLGKKIRNLPLKHGGATHVGLWVVFNDQVEDGIHLLENPNHRPARIITKDEMEEIELAAENGLSLSAKKLFGKVVSVFGIGVIVFVLWKITWGLVGDA